MWTVGHGNAVGVTFIIYVADIVYDCFDIIAGVDVTVAGGVGGGINGFGFIVLCVDDAVTPFIYCKVFVAGALKVAAACAVLIN